jgi:hypothetical protein
VLCFWTLFIVLSLSNTLSPEIWTRSIDWAQPSRFYLKTETESSLRNVVFWKINRTVFLDKDNVQKHNICTNVPSSQTFRPYLRIVCKISYRKGKQPLINQSSSMNFEWKRINMFSPTTVFRKRSVSCESLFLQDNGSMKSLKISSKINSAKP